MSRDVRGIRHARGSRLSLFFVCILLVAFVPAGAVAAPHVRDITIRADPGRTAFGAYTDTWGDNLVFDKNGDGHRDVLLSYHATQGWEIWLGNGNGGFTLDRTLARIDRHNCQAADFGGPDGHPDGRTDLYCVRGANRGTSTRRPNELLLQQPAGGFVNVAAEWGVSDPSGRGRTVEVLNARGNGEPSLFIGNKQANLHPSLDHIFEYVGNGYVERHTGGLPSEQNSRCSSTGDFDRDGRQDFLSCSYSLRLYRNLTRPDGPVSYREVAARQGLPPRPVLDAELLDLNGDGWRDLVTIRQHALDVRLNTKRAPYFAATDYRMPLRGGASLCSGHADGDRSTDLLVVQGLASRADDRQRPDRMLLNAGSGTAFDVLPVPQPPAVDGRNGNGDTCSAIPDYRGGRTAWIINNGAGLYGSRPEDRLGYRQLVVLEQ